MRHLAARFIPKVAENLISISHQSNHFKFNISPVHVVDPNLDFREQFKNVEKLKENLEKRKMFDLILNLPKIQNDYFLWWKAYSNFANSGLDRNDPNQREAYFKFRNELLKNSEGLLAALSLPNNLDFKQVHQQIDQKLNLNNFEKDFTEIWQNVRCNENTNKSSILLRDLRSSLLNFFKKVLKPAPVHFSGPFLVRPALVECCNISLNEVPLITDGIDSPFCLVGTNIPSFLSVLVNGCLTPINNWPISLLAAGPVYYKSLTDSRKFNQNEQISILTIGRNVEECEKRQNEIFTIFSKFLKKILKKEENELLEFEKQPENLRLWERSSLIIGNRKIKNNDDEIINIASFSNIGDYISRRAHIIFNIGKNNKDDIKNKTEEKIVKNQNYVQMAFTTINLDNLTKCF
ncbi:hypothetical protein ACQ4LE_007543 [Meloidogyne hapla]